MNVGVININIYYTSECKSGNLYGTTFYEIQFY